MFARLIPLLAVAASLLLAAPALADDYTVTTTASGDSSCTGSSPTWTCPTLEGAVNDSNENSAEDEIVLQAPGTYSASQTLTLGDDVTIVGQGPRVTAIDGGDSRQVVQVNPGVTASLINVTIQHGRPGNIVNQGDLTLVFARVTQGQAVRGAGISNQGTLSVLYSLVDNNHATDGTGGGIYSDGTGDLEVAESTVAFNSGFGGGGIFVAGTGVNDILQVTIARNTGGGIAIGGQASAAITASLLAANSTGNCSTPTPIDEGANLDDGTTCALDDPSSKVNVNPGLSADLVNAGGPTDVLTFLAGSPAVDMVNPCFSFYDQRVFQRITAFGQQPCDAGAYEQSATGPAQPTIESGPSGPTTATSASFQFSAPTGDGAAFVCQLAGPGQAGGYHPCTSPVTYTGLAPGDYVFAVAIADPTGQQPSGSPSVRTFSVAAPPAQIATPTPTPSPTPAPTATAVPQKSATGVSRARSRSSCRAASSWRSIRARRSRAARRSTSPRARSR